MSPRNQPHQQPRDLSRRTFLGWTGGLGAAVLVSACSAPSSTSGDGEKVTKSSQDVDTIAFDYPFTFLPVFAGVTKFAKERAKEKGVKLEQTSDNGRPDVQASNLDTLIAKKVPAIVSFPMVFEAVEAQAAKAVGAGCIWVTYGGTLKNQSASITFSFEEGGRLLGEDAAKWANDVLGGKGKIAFLVDDTIELGRKRTAGMIDAFTKAAPGVEVVAREQAIDPDTGLSKTKAILAKHPDLNIVLGITDGAAYGGYKAITGAGRSEQGRQDLRRGPGRRPRLTPADFPGDVLPRLGGAAAQGHRLRGHRRAARRGQRQERRRREHRRPDRPREAG